jgi:plasmid stabilization system protein ParE
MRRLVLSKRASKKLGKLLEYLELEWSVKVQQEFINKLDDSLNHIRKYPKSCIKTDHVKGLHMLVVTKQTSVFYRFNSKAIFVVTIFDNRMNPIKLHREVK